MSADNQPQAEWPFPWPFPWPADEITHYTAYRTPTLLHIDGRLGVESPRCVGFARARAIPLHPL